MPAASDSIGHDEHEDGIGWDGLFPSKSELRDQIHQANLELDAARYRWLRANWARLLTDLRWNGENTPRTVHSIFLGPAVFGTVDVASLDRALDIARQTSGGKS